MNDITVNQFRDNLKEKVDKIIANHGPLLVTRRGKDSFIVISEEDWNREQKTRSLLPGEYRLCCKAGLKKVRVLSDTMPVRQSYR